MKGFKITKENISRLNDPAREEFMPTSGIIQVMGNLKGKVLADVGCGTGYYSAAFSESVGEKGTVYAIDVSEDMLEQVTYKTKALSNVVNILSSESSIPIETGCVDVAISLNSFHEFDQEATLIEIKRILRKNGELYLIDWSAEKDSPPGPPKDHRILREDIILICEDTGLKLENEFSPSLYHYGFKFLAE